MTTKNTPPVPPIPTPAAADDLTPTAPEAAPEAPTAGAPEPVQPNPYAAAAPAADATAAASPYAATVAAPVAPTAAPQYAPGQPYQPYQAGPPSGLSIASMIVGLVALFFSLFGSGLLPGIAAVITGHLASKRQPHAKGFWLTGIITGYVSIGIGLIVAAFWIVIFAVGAASGWS